MAGRAGWCVDDRGRHRPRIGPMTTIGRIPLTCHRRALNHPMPDLLEKMAATGSAIQDDLFPGNRVWCDDRAFAVEDVLHRTPGGTRLLARIPLRSARPSIPALSPVAAHAVDEPRRSGIARPTPRTS